MFHSSRSESEIEISGDQEVKLKKKRNETLAGYWVMVLHPSKMAVFIFNDMALS